MRAALLARILPLNTPRNKLLNRLSAWRLEVFATRG